MRAKPRPPATTASPLGGEETRTPLDWPRQTGQLDRLMAAIAVRKKRRRRRLLAAAGGAAALCLAGLLWFAQPRESVGIGLPSPSPALVLLPERRALPDGSVVELKDGSEIAVDFSGRLRRVTLRNGGAHFQVEKDAERAFVVEAGGVEFRAVGTAFAVHLNHAKVEMVVTEGRVAVERAAGPDVAGPVKNPTDPGPAPWVLVEAGNQVEVSLTGAEAAVQPRISSLSAAESGQKLAWRVPRLELDNTPLIEAIAAINRYRSVPLEIGDAELGAVGVSGVLQADNVEPLLRMLENNYGIRADRSTAGKITLLKAR